MKQKNNNKHTRLIHTAIFLLTALLLFSPFFIKFDTASLKTLGIFGIAMVNFISSSTLFLPTPGFLATGIGGTMFNPILVALASSMGSTLGEGVGFLFGYTSKKLSPSQKHVLDFMSGIFRHHHAPIAIIAMAFIPNPIFDILGIAAGAALFPIRKFLLFVFIGRFARDLIIAFVGSLI